MTFLIVAIIVTLGFYLTMSSAFTLRQTMIGYHYDGPFRGTLYKSHYRMASAEASAPCLLGADRNALYIMRLPGPPRRGWAPSNDILDASLDLRFPWRALRYKWGRIFWRRCLWSRVESPRLDFYVPADIGARLLADADRPPPPRS